MWEIWNLAYLRPIDKATIWWIDIVKNLFSFSDIHLPNTGLFIARESRKEVDRESEIETQNESEIAVDAYTMVAK